ncbi:hypothetical protein DPMN_084388 [Dreissena polymorpha]|uniref:Uncharacterized protein n=1 Tax=Dreissena polymorpha TaxID=45954 RepID=A0A9D3YAY0_DREPO|nr:hypothetical protein DPMN_084388 [Dreissena polymorpha]
MSCRCARQLVAQASWEKGAYFYTRYGCGQAWCTRKSADVYKIMSLNAGGTFFERYLCRCRRSDACRGDLLTANLLSSQSPQIND